MEINWSTFVLEIINFLVLVWILKHFLYKPVLDVIARRQAGIEKTLADAKSLHTEAEKLQEQYESRLSDWNQEKQQEHEVLAHELEAERTRKMAEIQTSLEQEKQKTRVTEERRQAESMRKIEESALVQGARFATHLLELAAGPETEIRLVELMITELSQLSDERITAFRSNYGKNSETLVVTSAYPLPDDLSQRLAKALEKIAGPNMVLRFAQDKKLLAGVQVTLGPFVLGANLRDELKGFAELAYAE